MMEVNDENIDWDKLLDLIERDSLNSDNLSDEEKSMLAMAKKMRIDLMLSKFPSNQGWERFVQARDQGDRRRRLIIKRCLVAACILLLLGVPVWWLNNNKKNAEDQIVQASENIMLKRSNGTVIELGTQAKTIKDKVIEISSDSAAVIYNTVATTAGSQVIMDTLNVPRGKTYRITLPDGSSIALNAGSSVVFPEVFTGTRREVYVRGEVFIDVKHDPQHPFIVHADKVAMQVLGTAFNVNTFGKNLTTTLVRGKVMVIAGQQKVVLQPGEQSVYKSDGSLDKHKVDTRIYTAWHDGDLYFDDASLQEITTTLGRVYNYDIDFKQDILKNIRLTLDMRKPADIKGVINQINKTGSDVKFTITGRNIKIEKKN